MADPLSGLWALGGTVIGLGGSGLLERWRAQRETRAASRTRHQSLADRRVELELAAIADLYTILDQIEEAVGEWQRTPVTAPDPDMPGPLSRDFMSRIIVLNNRLRLRAQLVRSVPELYAALDRHGSFAKTLTRARTPMQGVEATIDLTNNLDTVGDLLAARREELLRSLEAAP